ncbi:MAG: hypothetical protein Q8L48_38230 [Archangium sp.]|nr:hypothetical protein [Archangium sp.]
MRHLFVSVLFLTACGPDVAPWKGTWGGSGSVNTGRLPMPFTGTLTISDGARFAATSDAQGMPAVSFACTLTAATADAAAVTFKGPVTVELIATPADGCTRQVTVDDGSATRDGDALTATVRGKLKTDCTGGSSTAENFLLDLAATRK